MGYRIQVGKTNYINVPLKMLRKVFEEAILNNGIYDRKVFIRLYPQETQQKTLLYPYSGKAICICGYYGEN